MVGRASNWTRSGLRWLGCYWMYRRHMRLMLGYWLGGKIGVLFRLFVPKQVMFFSRLVVFFGQLMANVLHDFIKLIIFISRRRGLVQRDVVNDIGFKYSVVFSRRRVISLTVERIHIGNSSIRVMV